MKEMVLKSDKSGEIIDGGHYTFKLVASDGRAQNFEGDLTLDEGKALAKDLNARSVKRRGRRPAAAAA